MTRVRIKGINENGRIIGASINHENKTVFKVETDLGKILSEIPFNGVEYINEDTDAIEENNKNIGRI